MNWKSILLVDHLKRKWEIEIIIIIIIRECFEPLKVFDEYARYEEIVRF